MKTGRNDIMVYISEVDAYGSCARAETSDTIGDNSARRYVINSKASSLMEKEWHDTTMNPSLYLRGASGGGSRGSTKHRSANRMGSSSRITAGVARLTDDRLGEEQQPQQDLDLELKLAGLDAALRRRSARQSPRQDGWLALQGQHETMSELATFLRNVTPPPSNYMSLPDPSMSSSPASSLRRRNSNKKKNGMLKRALSLLMKRGSRKKAVKRRGAVSPDLARASSTRRRRPPRIKLPDTAVAGTTVDGFRHIAISIPIEHAHLGPEPRYRFGLRTRRSRSLSSPELSPKIYEDVKLRPRTAFATTESHRATQLGPLAEEREPLSSTSWGKENSQGHGQACEEALAARRVRLASRNTFGPVYEKVRSVNTSPDVVSSPITLRTSNESSRHETPRTSEELRSAAHRETLEALVKGPRASSNLPASRGARPTSAYSFRSFASALPPQQQRVYYHRRHSSLQPSDSGATSRRPWTLSESMQYHSWDSSRDHTVRESVFSEQSHLDSIGTMESGDVPPSSVVGAGRTPRRFVGVDVVKDSSPRKQSSLVSKRGSGSGSGSEPEAARGEMSSWSAVQANDKNSIAPLNPELASVSMQGRAHEVDVAQLQGSTTKAEPRILFRQPLGTTAEDTLLSQTGRVDERKNNNHQMLLRSSETNTDLKGKGKVAGRADDDQAEPDTRAKTESVESRGQEQRLKITQHEEQTIQSRGSRDGSPSSRRKSHEGRKGSPPSLLLSNQERLAERKSTLLSRKQRVAELRAILEKPGAQPSDLLWKRRLSSSSDGSQDSVTPQASKAYLEPADSASVGPKPVSQALSLTKVVTVADVAPSNQELLGRPSKESITSSAPSLATLATVIRPSPVLPYGSVTPPDSPPASPTSQLSFADADGSPVLRRPIAPLKRIDSYHSRKTGSRASDSGRHSPVVPRDPSPPRPKTAGKGMLTSKKSFFGRTAKTQLGWGQGQGLCSTDGAVASETEEPSVLRMTRSQIFQRYEALREKQTRDMERRIKRLERNEDRLLSSVLPLLGDLQRTLGKVGRKGKGKEIDSDDRQSPLSGYQRGGVHNRFTMRDAEEGPHRDVIYSNGGSGLDDDEVVVLHRQSPAQDGGTRERSRRLYLKDSLDNISFTSNDDRSFPPHDLEELDPRHRRWSRRATLPDPTIHIKKQEPSALDTMLGKARPNSMAVTSELNIAKTPIRTDDTELGGRAASRNRALALGPSPSPEVRRNSPAVHEQDTELPRRPSTQSISSLETYDDTDASFVGPSEEMRRPPARGEDDARPYRPGGSGMETIEPLMRELQVSGSRPSTESLGSGDIGDDEVRKLRERPGPRSVVGFGAFGI